MELPTSLYFDYRPYPFRRPPEVEGAAVRHAVAIVGAGPVGLGLAAMLARYGVRSVIIENDATECGGSRAAALIRRSQEFLQQVGAGPRFQRDALPWRTGWTHFRGREIHRFDMPHSEDERYFPMANLPQNGIERVLIETVAETGLVEIRWRSEVVGVEQDGAEARLRIATPEGDYVLRADWVVAADGARSPVRKAMGLSFTGTAYAGNYVVVDILAEIDEPAGRRAWFEPPPGCGVSILVHKFPFGVWRIDYKLEDDQDPEPELRPEVVKRRVDAVLKMWGHEVPWRFDWVGVYQPRCLTLEEYVHGRVIFAGDAAHLMPIFGARGLNAGYAGAGNLGWKLAAVSRGWSGPGLLRSYTTERLAATRAIHEEAGRSARFMSPPSEGYALMRDAALSLSLRHDWAGRFTRYRHSPFRYEAGLHESWPEREAGFSAGPRLGAPVACVRLPASGGAADFLTDHFDVAATAMVFLGGAPPDPALATALRRLAAAGPPFRTLWITRGEDVAEPGTVLRDPEGRVFAAYGAGPGTVYLIRPDWHVAARAHGPSAADIEAAARRIWNPGA